MNDLPLAPFASNISQTLCQHVEDTLTDYLEQYREHLPANLHELVINAIELPLFKLVLKHTHYNQSHAARMLGINRATLNKKMHLYGLIEQTPEAR